VDGLSWRSLLYIAGGVVGLFGVLAGGSWVLYRYFTDYREEVAQWESKGVSDDGRTITVDYITSRCSYDPFDRVEREETASTVTLAVVLRHPLGRGGGCEDIAVHHTTEVTLDRPLGERRLIDRRTGVAPDFGTPTSAEVRIRQVVDVSGGSYPDGFVSEIRVYQEPDGGRVHEDRLPDPVSTGSSTLTSTLNVRIRPGEYRLVSFQRPCDGDCASFAGPKDRCGVLIQPSPLEPVVVTVRVRPDEGCRIKVG